MNYCWGYFHMVLILKWKAVHFHGLSVNKRNQRADFNTFSVEESVILPNY